MNLTATYRVPGDPAHVFAALIDPDVLKRCIEGCESLTRQEDGSYEARLRVGLGSIKGTFVGHIRMTDVRAPDSYTLRVEGRGTPGFVNGSAPMRLTPDADGTIVRCDAVVTVGGVIASVGSRLIEVGARRAMDRFFAALSTELSRT